MKKLSVLLLVLIVSVLGCGPSQDKTKATVHSLDLASSEKVNRETLPTPTTDADDTAVEPNDHPANHALINFAF